VDVEIKEIKECTNCGVRYEFMLRHIETKHGIKP
jgi:hypothetical protein